MCLFCLQNILLIFDVTELNEAFFHSIFEISLFKTGYFNEKHIWKRMKRHLVDVRISVSYKDTRFLQVSSFKFQFVFISNSIHLHNLRIEYILHSKHLFKVQLIFFSIRTSTTVISNYTWSFWAVFQRTIEAFKSCILKLDSRLTWNYLIWSSGLLKSDQFDSNIIALNCIVVLDIFATFTTVSKQFKSYQTDKIDIFISPSCYLSPFLNIYKYLKRLPHTQRANWSD